MIIKLNNKKLDTDKLTYEEMQAVLIDLDVAIGSIEQQRADAALRRYETGESASHEWFMSLNRAKNVLTQKRQQLQILIGMKGKSQRQRQGGSSIANFFMEVAREYLDENDFKRILFIAEKRRKDKEGVLP